MIAILMIGTGREEGDVDLMDLILFLPVTYRYCEFLQDIKRVLRSRGLIKLNG